jgi:hypothetical protein
MVVKVRQAPLFKYSELTNSWLDMLLFSNRSVLYLYIDNIGETVPS